MRKDHLKITSPALQTLADIWENEQDSHKKNEYATKLHHVLRELERDCFFARCRMKELDSWYQVLTPEETDPSLAKKHDFYRNPLIELLEEYKDGVEPLKAIKILIQRLEPALNLSDFHMTESMRFRYDTTGRMLVAKLKEEGIVSKNKDIKNKLWALEKHIPTQQKLL